MNNPLSPERRRFLQTSLLSGVTAAALPALAGAREMVAPPEPTPRPQSFELDEATIADLQEGMASGKYTASSITQKYLERIDEIDKRGPALASVIEVNPDALAIADGLDRERAQKGVRGPMHGIPVLIKDNIDTADRMQTTAGSLALLGSKPARCVCRAAIAGSRSSDSGEDEFERVGEHSIFAFEQRLERTRRADEESLCSRPQSLRIEFGVGCRDRGESLRGGSGHGDGRLGSVSRVGQWTGGNQADSGAGEPSGDHSYFA